MQQRPLRLGDIVDDYCPRERRITNHAVVAMIEDEVRQTRCTTCDAEHPYKAAQVPPKRRAHERAAPPPAARPDGRDSTGGKPAASEVTAAPGASDAAEADAGRPARPLASDVDDAAASDRPAGPGTPSGGEDEPVQRPLIRATLQRPAGQPAARPAPAFTAHHIGGRHSGVRNRDSRAAQHATRHTDNDGWPRSRGGGPWPAGNRPGKLGREGDGRPTLLSHHSGRRTSDRSQLRARPTGKGEPRHHGKKRTK